MAASHISLWVDGVTNKSKWWPDTQGEVVAIQTREDEQDKAMGRGIIFGFILVVFGGEMKKIGRMIFCGVGSEVNKARQDVGGVKNEVRQDLGGVKNKVRQDVCGVTNKVRRGGGETTKFFNVDNIN